MEINNDGRDLNGAELATKGKDRTAPASRRVKSRLHHFTWAWYTLTMSTGGLAQLLASQPHTFSGLITIGKIIYIFDLFLFVSITLLLAYRFLTYKGTLARSFTHSTEGLFIPTFFLSGATIISCMAKYGTPNTGNWLEVTIRVLFWVYFAITFSWAAGYYTWLFTAKASTIQSMTPAWILPTFPFMLTGTIAATAASGQPDAHAMAMIVAGVTGQGLGMMLSVLLFAQYIRRLMNYGPPSPNTRPGMFIAVGPPSFTGLALIGMSQSIPSSYGYFAKHPSATEILQVMALFTSIFLWSLALWFFAISLINCLTSYRSMTFHLTWWSFVFPNVGFTVNTISIGKQLESEGILWVGSVMTILIVIAYIFVFVAHARAVWKRQILFEGKDEDSDQ